MKAGVFSVNLDVFETACAKVTDCTFDKTAYEPYAFGFLFKEGTTKCDSFGPYIMTKTGRTLPFEGFYWNTYYDPQYYTVLYTGVSYSAEFQQFSVTDTVKCVDF